MSGVGCVRTEGSIEAVESPSRKMIAGLKQERLDPLAGQAEQFAKDDYVDFRSLFWPVGIEARGFDVADKRDPCGMTFAKPFRNRIVSPVPCPLFPVRWSQPGDHFANPIGKRHSRLPERLIEQAEFKVGVSVDKAWQERDVAQVA